MESLIILIVNWTMGAVFIGFFLLVCLVLSLIVYNMAKSGKKKSDTSNDETSTEL